MLSHSSRALKLQAGPAGCTASVRICSLRPPSAAGHHPVPRKGREAPLLLAAPDPSYSWSALHTPLVRPCAFLRDLGEQQGLEPWWYSPTAGGETEAQCSKVAYQGHRRARALGSGRQGERPEARCFQNSVLLWPFPRPPRPGLWPCRAACFPPSSAFCLRPASFSRKLPRTEGKALLLFLARPHRSGEVFRLGLVFSVLLEVFTVFLRAATLIIPRQVAAWPVGGGTQRLCRLPHPRAWQAPVGCQGPPHTVRKGEEGASRPGLPSTVLRAPQRQGW